MPRHHRLRLTVLLLAPLLLAVTVLGLLWASFCWFSWGILGDSGQRAAEQHFIRARELSGRSQWAEALAEYEAAHDLEADINSLLGIAECHDHLGAYDTAIEHYDQAIRDADGWYQPYHDKARCMERNAGEQAVVAWFGELEQREGDVAKYRYLLGSHHMESGRPAKALPCFLRALDLVMQEQRVSFSDGDELVPAERIAEMTWGDLGSMWPEVTYVAKCYYRTGQAELAYHWATRGLSLHRHINRVKGYCTPAQIEAGDTSCRLLRARIHMDRREWGAAQREIDHAKAFPDSWSEKASEDAQRELSQRRRQ